MENVDHGGGGGEHIYIYICKDSAITTTSELTSTGTNNLSKRKDSSVSHSRDQGALKEGRHPEVPAKYSCILSAAGLFPVSYRNSHPKQKSPEKDKPRTA